MICQPTCLTGFVLERFALEPQCSVLANVELCEDAAGDSLTLLHRHMKRNSHLASG